MKQTPWDEAIDHWGRGPVPGDLLKNGNRMMLMVVSVQLNTKTIEYIIVTWPATPRSGCNNNSNRHHRLHLYVWKMGVDPYGGEAKRYFKWDNLNVNHQKRNLREQQ